jgi:uncharacterized DUF497 family protein
MDEVVGDLEWDADKRQRTLRERQLDFADARFFDFDTAATVEDGRRDYGEVRSVSTGWLRGRLHVLCWTRRGKRIRVISLRKANDREQQAYAEDAGRPSAAD